MVRAALAALLLGAPAGAGAQECRLALLLAMDVSSSVDVREDALQREGLARALVAPDVVAAFLEGDLPVALAAYEWSGRHNQSLIVDWRLIANAAQLEAIAGELAASVRSENEFPTAMGYALGYGVRLLEAGPPCLFRTIDVAGDGVNNEGFGPLEAYAAFPFGGVTVNGLVVEATPQGALTELLDFYENEVIHGPGAFLEVAQGFTDYERAMRRKLLRELETPTIGGLRRGDGSG